MSSLEPCDIYAKQLFHLGHGYPLWIPEPDKSGRELLVGDVGYLRGGKFKSLFNTMATAEDKLNGGGVPEGFSPFSPKNLLMDDDYAHITQEFLCGKSIHSVEAMARTGMSAPG